MSEYILHLQNKRRNEARLRYYKLTSLSEKNVRFTQVIFVNITNNNFIHICQNLSYDVAVIQWKTSCHKKCTTTRIIILWPVHVTSLTTSLSTMRFLTEIMFILKVIKSPFKGHMIHRILSSWSFHVKFIKLAEVSFHKFYMK